MNKILNYKYYETHTGESVKTLKAKIFPKLLIISNNVKDLKKKLNDFDVVVSCNCYFCEWTLTEYLKAIRNDFENKSRGRK